jgi:membrane protein involved in colicin uptake
VITLRLVRRLVISVVLAWILGAIAFLVLLERALDQIGEAGSMAGAVMVAGRSLDRLRDVSKRLRDSGEQRRQAAPRHRRARSPGLVAGR